MHRLIHCSLRQITPERHHWQLKQAAETLHISFNKTYRVLRVEGRHRRYYFVEGTKSDYVIKREYYSPVGRVRFKKQGDSGFLQLAEAMYYFFIYAHQVSVHDASMRMRLLVTVPGLESISREEQVALFFAIMEGSKAEKMPSVEVDTALNG